MVQPYLLSSSYFKRISPDFQAIKMEGDVSTTDNVDQVAALSLFCREELAIDHCKSSSPDAPDFRIVGNQDQC